MVVKVYISGISGNKEVKKRQQRVLMILDSRGFKYDLIDISEPDNEADKDFMHNNSTSLGATIGDANPRHPLPPQIFNDSTYCGDYDQFDMSNEIDELEKFLKLAPDDAASAVTSSAEIQLTTNGRDETKEEETNEAEALEDTNEAEAVQKEDVEVNGATQEEADGGNVEEDGEAEGNDDEDDGEA